MPRHAFRATVTRSPTGSRTDQREKPPTSVPLSFYGIKSDRLLGGTWLAAMEGEPPAERTYQHVAFAVSEAELPKYQAKLQALGVEVRPPRNRVTGEGLSMYFYDFDNHLFELHTGTLEQRLARYAA